MLDKNALLISLSESDRTDFGRVDFAAQSAPQKVFSAVWGLESEVNNGGFSQYFESWSGEAANFTPTALRAIGANACANIVQRALRAVSEDPLPDDQDERGRLLESVPDAARSALEELDSEFFSYPDDLTELLFAYVAAHPNVFGEMPDENV
jgi:Domain of unknown function (DUF4375)